MRFKDFYKYPSCLLLIVAHCLPHYAEAKRARSHKAIAEFKRENPCPANGRRSGKCPGYVIDHVTALCVGGEDSPRNMQWQTKEEAKAKDKWECRKKF
jgi:hypothetical protein